MNTRQIIDLEDHITALEAENAVSQRTIDELEIVIERLQKNYNVLHHWAIIGQNAVELAAEALKVDNQDVDPQTMVASLVYSEAVMTTEVKRLQSYIETLEAIEASKDWAPAIGDRVRMVAGTGHTRRLIGYAKITEITEPHDSHPYHLHADDDLSPMLWSNRAGIVKA